MEIGLARPFFVALPRYAGTADTTVPLLPLLQALGPEQLFLLLSAVLCERRVIFVSGDAETLSQSVLAAASMVLPFSWQHIFIPLLPSGLLDYAQAPMPFMLGVRRNQLPQLERMGAALSDCVVVDVDQGTLRTAGRVTVVDFVGDRGGGLKQASEHVDGLVKAGASLVRGLMGAAPSREPQGPRDLMVAVLADLNRVLAQRPGADTLRGVASGLVNAAAKTLGAGGRSGTEAEAVIQWRVDGERVLRDSLLLFFVCLFCELPEFMNRQGRFDHGAFLARRQQSGDSHELLDFLSRLRGSQMFERFCEGGPGEAAGSDTEGPFQAVCRELRVRRLPPTIANVKAVIVTRGAVRGGGGEMHAPLLQHTDGRADGPEQRQLAERVLTESSSSDTLLQVMRTLAFRLDACQVAGGRGVAGAAGLRALALLRMLLLSGPHAVLSAALDFIPVLRAMLRDRKRGGLGIGAALSAIGGAIGGAALAGGAGNASAQQQGDDLRDSARETLLLLLDHARLQHQRKFASLARLGAVPHLYAPMQRVKAHPFQDLASLHASLKPAEATWAAAPPALRLTTPMLEATTDASSEKSRRDPSSSLSFSPSYSPSPSSSFSSAVFSPSYSSLPSAPAHVPASVPAPLVEATAAVPLATYRQRLEAIYARHLPAKLPEVGALLVKYAGSEEEVLGKLEARFGRVAVVVNGVTLRVPPAPPAVDQPQSQSTPIAPSTPILNPPPATMEDAGLLFLATPAPANAFVASSSAHELVPTPTPKVVQAPPSAPFVHRGDIPPQFRIVDRDTGVVSDLRLMSSGGGGGAFPFPSSAPAPAPAPAPSALSQSFPVLSPTIAQPTYSAPVVFRGDIPPEFRVVNRDTGVVSDLRLMGGGGDAVSRSAMPPSWQPGTPIPSPQQYHHQGPRTDPFAGLNVLRK